MSNILSFNEIREALQNMDFDLKKGGFFEVEYLGGVLKSYLLNKYPKKKLEIDTLEIGYIFNFKGANKYEDVNIDSIINPFYKVCKKGEIIAMFKINCFIKIYNILERK